MASRRIFFGAIFAGFVLVLAWTVFKWLGTHAANEPGPVVALTGTHAAKNEPIPDNDKEPLDPGKELSAITLGAPSGTARAHVFALSLEKDD